MIYDRLFHYFVNCFQDNTWGYGLIVSGFLFCLVVIVYGPNRYRRVLINDYGINDCNLSVIWIPVIA